MASKALQIPKGAHTEIIGAGGATIKRIQQTHGVRIVVPGRQEPSCEVLVTGPSAAAVEAAEKEIEGVIGFPVGTAPLTTVSLDIGSDEHGLLIGKGGSTLKALEKDNGVNIDIPKRGSADTSVVVQGPAAGVEKAHKAIEGLLHHKVGQKGVDTPRPVLARLELNANVAEALFFSDDDDANAFQRFLAYIESATQSIDICVFNLTDDRISNVLVRLHSHGVKIRLITDNDQSISLGSDIETLRKVGIPVRKDSSPAHMHHKFAVIDNLVLLNGSFNWTRGAAGENYENIMILGTPALVHSYATEFERLWGKFQASA